MYGKEKFKKMKKSMNKCMNQGTKERERKEGRKEGREGGRKKEREKNIIFSCAVENKKVSAPLLNHADKIILNQGLLWWLSG